MSTVIRWASRVARDIGWYVTSLMGDRAYDNYVAHHLAGHPEAPPLGVREFWIQRYRDQDANPGSRCC